MQVTICMVILLQLHLISGQEKRHISNADENRTVPKVGPALRPFSGDPKSNKLEAEVIGDVVLGEDLSLKVALQEEKGQIQNCLWTSPSGVGYNVEKESVTTLDGNINEFEILFLSTVCFTEFDKLIFFG
jgi:hypothetical protein